VTADWTLTWHANCACWRDAYIMMMSSLSGSGTWVASSGIQVGSAHPDEEDACDAWRASGAWPATSPTRDDTCGCFRHQISTRFLPVASSLPPLHSSMVKTQF
jgi:hypothetical protein